MKKVPHVPVKLYSNFMKEYRRKEDSFRLSNNKKSHHEVFKSLSKKSNAFFVKKRRSNMNSKTRHNRKKRLLHIAKAAAKRNKNVSRNFSCMCSRSHCGSKSLRSALTF